MLGLLLSLSCGPGPTVHLGRARDSGAAESDAGPQDAGESDADADDDDDDDGPRRCESSMDCRRDDPVCDPERLICVDCVQNDDCESDEICVDYDCEELPFDR
jgi:hypothetical protein